MNRVVWVLTVGLVSTLSLTCATAIRTGKQAYFFIQSQLSRSEVRIILDKSFVDLYADRATIDTHFSVDRAGRFAHANFLDGDLHVAGRAVEIGLPIVAEVENATLRPQVVNAVHFVAGTGTLVPMTGVWRIWSEHFGSAEETQGRELESIERTNPPHVFEIHPVTCFDGWDLAGSFVPVRGFRPEPAEVVFRSLRSSRFRIVPGETTVTIFARRREFNDADFVMRLDDDPQRVAADGRFVRADVIGADGEPVAERIRMVFVRDTAPEELVKKLRPGDRLHVFGIPRIDLSEVAARIERSRDDARVLDGTLPYEFVIVGVFPEKKPVPARRALDAG